MGAAYRSPEHEAQVRAWCLAALARWPVPHGTQTIETPGGHTHVLSGRAGDQVCVYLPGTGFNVATSTAVLGALASWCGVYAADLPGQPGPSASTRPEDELSGYAGWVADLIRWVRSQHVHERIALVGHSHGPRSDLSAEPDSVDGPAVSGPAGLIGVRPSFAMLRATVPWLLRRNDAGSSRLLAYMSGPAHEPSADLVEWMSLVARACRRARPFGTTSCSGGGVATCGWWRSASTTSSFPSTGFVRHAAPRCRWSDSWCRGPDTCCSTRSQSS
jgi:hypothetical protein